MKNISEHNTQTDTQTSLSIIIDIQIYLLSMKLTEDKIKRKEEKSF